ncbi:hypothetical protein R1flu_020418 [Riccia fluitans]|uniref:Uncharacterized protein n=1 Tax=Riccia fluitans TaxID=41844 RepID=A0ABD1ZLG1_9MARC
MLQFSDTDREEKNIEGDEVEQSSISRESGGTSMHCMDDVIQKRKRKDWVFALHEDVERGRPTLPKAQNALNDSPGANPAAKPSTFDWLSPQRTPFSNIVSSSPVIHLDEDEDVDQDFGQKAASEDSEHVPDFEPPFVEEEDVDEIGKEVTPHPFWTDPISRAGTFKLVASQDERTPHFRETLWEPKPPWKPKSSITVLHETHLAAN